MQRQQTITLGIVTAIAVVAATLVMLKRAPDEQPKRDALLPGLSAQIDAVATIRVRDHDHTVEIQKSADGRWLVPEKFNYAADLGMVRKTVIGLATMKVVEEKTNNADYYGRLGVEEVTATDAKSRMVELITADGKTAAAVIIGNPAAGKTPPAMAGGSDRAYARLMGEKQSYLVSGAPEIDMDIKKWLDAALFTLDKERLRRIEVRHGDGKIVTVGRAMAADQFTVDNLPKDRKAKTYGGVDNLTGAMGYLAYEYVRPAAAMAKPVTTKVETFDGLTLTVAIDGAWAHFSAGYNPDVAENGEGVAIMPNAPADGAQEAADINARLAPWDYSLTDYKRKDLTPTLEDLLEPKAEKSKK